MIKKFKVQNSKFKILILLTLAFAFCLLTFYFILPTFAQTLPCPTQSPNPRVQGGLISTPDISDSNSKFSNSSGICVVDPKAAFVPYKIPTYDDLKSIYYTQAKTISGVVTKHDPLVGDQTHSNISMTTGTDHLYYIKKTNPMSIDGNLTITGNILGGGNQSGVVFVDGNLNIGPMPSNKLDYGNNNSGLVFVVGGNVLIDKSVTRIDAVIISQGIIYTATDASITCTTNSATVPSALTINGSLISLDSFKPINFCRTLAYNNQPAEQINNQPKYLVILRNLFSQTYQKWSEIQ